MIVGGVPRVSAGAVNVTITGSEEVDGHITKVGPVFTPQIGSQTIPFYFPGFFFRGWCDFNISAVPQGVTITDVWFEYAGLDHVPPGVGGNITRLNLQPNATGGPANLVYWSIGNGTSYLADGVFPVHGTNQIATLGGSVVADVQALVDASTSYFGLGFHSINETDANPQRIASTDNVTATPSPTLIISYDYPIQYVISDTYFENGTLRVPPVNVTATGDGFTDEFNTSGGYIYGNFNETEAFYWDIGGGFTRYIYGVGVSENFTITIPDGSDFTYSFTIKDLTGNVGTNSFLEAYRTINGSETLISRMPIEQPNAVPMNLVFGKTYRMKIRFGDGSTFDWGFLIPGSDTTITLLVRLVEFGDGAQVLYNYITVEATRTTGLIHIAYADARSNTVWANVSIRIRNGAVVQTYTRSNFTYAINYAGFNDSLGYIVTFTGYHSDFGVWGRTFILDQSFTFPDPPELDGIFGSVMVNFIPFMLTCITILVFPVSMQPIGLLAGGVMATMMSFIGWASWSAELLYFYWFIAILVNLVVRGRGN